MGWRGADPSPNPAAREEGPELSAYPPSDSIVSSTDALGRSKKPLNGELSSRIRKTALPTANAPTAVAATLVALRRESTPKPQNSSIAQETTITSSGHETGLASCSDISNRVCCIAPAWAPIDGSNCVCAGVFGLSAATAAFNAFNPGRYISTPKLCGPPPLPPQTVR